MVGVGDGGRRVLRRGGPRIRWTGGRARGRNRAIAVPIARGRRRGDRRRRVPEMLAVARAYAERESVGTASTSASATARAAGRGACAARHVPFRSLLHIWRAPRQARSALRAARELLEPAAASCSTSSPLPRGHRGDRRALARARAAASSSGPTGTSAARKLDLSVRSGDDHAASFGLHWLSASRSGARCWRKPARGRGALRLVRPAPVGRRRGSGVGVQASALTRGR